MLSLFLSTLEMMGLTFIIGFFVAGIIKLIAIWADSLEYHHSQEEELNQFTKLFKLRAKLGVLLGLKANSGYESSEDEREEFRKGINSDLLKNKPAGYYHGVSHGASSLSLMDYYYPKDTRIMFLKKQEKLKNKQKSNNKPLSPEE
ncbi:MULTISPECIES: hypothetical protein [Parabacteroides]|uniref:hypothetical protein n=1 Tax=Parabacteroides provencensis TaxID=1944636 RepID=UPI000C14A88C|nr:hypothetical protein [Parabacteroides provencensis]